MKWLNLLSISLQFISFWFVAPELLGSNALQRMERQIQRFLTILPNVLLMLGILIFAISLSVYGIFKGMEGAEKGASSEDYYNYIITLGITFFAYAIFMVYFKRIKNWLANHLAIPLTKKLIHSNETRLLALKIGAALFSVGFVIQVVLISIS